MGVTFSQLFPPAPSFTEKDLPDLTGKVFIVTGGASGIGADLVGILYNAGGKVYIAGRSQASAEETISTIQSKEPQQSSKASLHFLHVDLSDLATIKPAVQIFRETESKLDVLFNNAAVSLPPAGSVSAQGLELMMATNAVGPYLLTELLLPVLKQTPNARVVWTTSQNAELGAPKDGFTMDQIRKPGKDQVFNYNASKIGNQLLSSELARTGAVHSVVQNPGNVKTNLLRHMPGWQRTLVSPLLHSARQGAYTELFAGLSPDVQSGDYVIPWGRKHPIPPFIAATKRVEEGGSGLSLEFKKWCDARVEGFL